jgi:predicted RNase H-like HicB family nuclease
MARACFERLEDGTYYGEIPGFPGLRASGQTAEECAHDLRGALEDWILLNVADHTPLPELDGFTLEVGKSV